MLLEMSAMKQVQKKHIFKSQACFDLNKSVCIVQAGTVEEAKLPEL